jgi:RHS repeat-associated protein
MPILNMGARYYSSGLGRFITPDWSATPVPVPYADFGDPQSLNLYGYVRDIPTTGIDADGHQLTVDPQLQSTVDTLRQLRPNEIRNTRKRWIGYTGKAQLLDRSFPAAYVLPADWRCGHWRNPNTASNTIQVKANASDETLIRTMAESSPRIL